MQRQPAERNPRHRDRPGPRPRLVGEPEQHEDRPDAQRHPDQRQEEDQRQPLVVLDRVAPQVIGGRPPEEQPGQHQIAEKERVPHQEDAQRPSADPERDDRRQRRQPDRERDVEPAVASVCAWAMHTASGGTGNRNASDAGRFGRLVQASVARCLRTPPGPAKARDLDFGLVTAYAASATGARLSLATVLFEPITVASCRVKA